MLQVEKTWQEVQIAIELLDPLHELPDLSRFYKLYFVGIQTEAHDMIFKILLLINYDLKLVVANKTPQHIVIM